MNKIQDPFRTKDNDQPTPSSVDTGHQISESKSQEIQSASAAKTQKSDLQEKKAQTTTKLQKFFSKLINFFSKTPDPRDSSPSDMYLAEWDPTNLEDRKSTKNGTDGTNGNSYIDLDDTDLDDTDLDDTDLDDTDLDDTDSEDNISGNDILGNDILENDISGNDILENDISGDDIKANETPSKSVTFFQSFTSNFCFCLTKILPFFQNINCIAERADKIHAQKIINNESHSHSIAEQITNITTDSERQQRIWGDVFASLFTSSENQQNILSRLTSEFQSIPSNGKRLLEPNTADAFLQFIFGENLYNDLAFIDSLDLSWPKHLHLEFENPDIRNAFIKCLKEAADHSANYHEFEFSIQTSDNNTPTIQVSSK